MKIGLGLSILLCLLGVVASVVGIWTYSDLTQDLPSLEVLPALLEPPDGFLLRPTQFYDRAHEHVIYTLENPAVSGRQFLKVGTADMIEEDQFSRYLVDATLLETDPGFWKNPGFSLTGWTEGTHPTLAQQLVSDLLLLDEPASLRRSLRERLLAAQITGKFGREKILEWYLNSASYGDLIYGADAAARAYFGKSASDLTLAEAAMLAAVSKSGDLDPQSNLIVIKQQQIRIIQEMQKLGLITYSEAQQALAEDLVFRAKAEHYSIAPAFVSLVLKQLRSQINLERIRRGGYDIVTTLDYGLQMQADCTARIQISRLQALKEPESDTQSENCGAAHSLPNLQLSNEELFTDIHADVVILDPKTGQILSMVDDDVSTMDPIPSPKHPAGTILNPLLYLTAFTRGMSPATLLWDIPVETERSIEGTEQADSPKSLLDNFHGPVRARVALVNDYLSAAAEVLRQVRAENVLLTEKRFGISNADLQLNTGITLDDLLDRKITVSDAVSAYGILANQGVLAGQSGSADVYDNEPEGLQPASILKVIGADGKVWLDWTKAQTRSIISPQFAYLATHVLSDEIIRWESLGHPNALEIGRPTAVKVGTTKNGNASWVVGYIPQLVIGVWMGQDGEESDHLTSDMPSGIWHAIAKYTADQYPAEEFNQPPGISLLQVCDPSGLLVSELCPKIDQEVFLAGNEPTQVDNLYKKYLINRETGTLATVFTPLDMVEEKVFLEVPPQAAEWARNSGFPVPPVNYDVIYNIASGSEDVDIVNPEPFAQAGGQIRFIGNATGTNFSYYRLQVGKGLNPQEWIQIGEDVTQPVENGVLGTWDASGLEGLYVVQLQVIRQDQRIERDLLQITIDNVAPEVQIIAPAEGEKNSYEPGESILMQVSASDNLQLARVEFLVDGVNQRILLQPPFIMLWRGSLGEHTMTVRALDMAGNRTEVETQFSVNQ
jgi:membrane peptidoglycan carboxypeptidase